MRAFLLRHIRTIYTAVRNAAYMQSTGYTAVPVRFRAPEWERAVSFFLSRGLNFQRCIKARFDYERSRAKGSFYVHPNSLASERWLPLYQEACASLRDELRAELATQRSICTDYLLTTAKSYGFATPRVALTYTLFNPSLQLSHLFRYGLAVSERLQPVAEHYAAAAMGQYLLSPREYDEIWTTFIPPAFREQARKLTGDVFHHGI